MDDRDDWSSILAGALVRFKNLSGNMSLYGGGTFRPGTVLRGKCNRRLLWPKLVSSLCLSK